MPLASAAIDPYPVITPHPTSQTHSLSPDSTHSTQSNTSLKRKAAVPSATTSASNRSTTDSNQKGSNIPSNINHSDSAGGGAEETVSEQVVKRQRNTMAARKYRQKRLDQVADLEKALGDVTDERDELRLKLARREAEVDALREMLARKDR